ncbi:hypothetical protein CLOBOL_07133 [Enterocloster bolteae ATCC BAA-613]|uniref:Uncharacterized protein n=1 Tax=Enterocloster bolteae (strain ATCC BAA-613 / DSM 15670 / CCUG 46953 / JCM 12243 / WAL 16351) TaxID=411902 RepID=A8S589_ENTBW|nr:hypothetical protein CLOBOL_07133 [Enterocloster bolteae ATCC BAA-613]
MCWHLGCLAVSGICSAESGACLAETGICPADFCQDWDLIKIGLKQLDKI